MLGLGKASLGRVAANWKRWCCRFGAGLIVQQPGQMLSKVVTSHEADAIIQERLSAAFVRNIEVFVCWRFGWMDGSNLERPCLLSCPRREVAVPLWRVTRWAIEWKVREHVIHVFYGIVMNQQYEHSDSSIVATTNYPVSRFIIIIRQQLLMESCLSGHGAKLLFN